jgi:hypothetical protein
MLKLILSPAAAWAIPVNIESKSASKVLLIDSPLYLGAFTKWLFLIHDVDALLLGKIGKWTEKTTGAASMPVPVNKTRTHSETRGGYLLILPVCGRPAANSNGERL